MKLATLLTSLAVLVLVAACGPAAEPLSPPPPLPPPLAPAPSATATANAAPDFRARAPASGPEIVFTPPRFQEARLSNGARVLIAERHELPLVAVDLLFERGADQAVPGVGSFTASMLFQGTVKRSALALSDELRGLGIGADASADYDGITISAHCLLDKLPAALDLLADVVQHPAFAKDEIERARSRRLTTLLQQNDQPGAILSTTQLALLYPAGHPYHLALIGDEAAVKKLTVADLRAFHAQSMVPERLTIAVAGDVRPAELIPLLERALGSWKGSAPRSVVPEKPSAVPGPKITLVDRPGLTQSSVAVTAVGPSRLTPDHDALTLMNTLLGGYYSSRLNANLRERHAYTYGARSSFDLRRGPGPFTAGATVVREQTGPAIREILTEISRMRDELVSEEELEDARIRAIRRLPSRFESASETSGAMATLALFGLPLDEYATLAERLRKVTREDVKRVAATTLADESLRVVVVGDGKVVKAQLDALEMGEVVVKSLPRKTETPAPKPAAGKPAAGKPAKKK